MPNKVFTIKLDLNGQVIAPKIQIRRNDYDTNVFSAQILQNGVPVDITGWTPIFECLTPARKFIRDDGSEFGNMTVVDAANGKIEYTVSDKVFTSLGDIDVAYFAFEKLEGSETKRFSTGNFYFTVISDVMTGSVAVEDYLSQVTTLINDINQLKLEYETLNPANYATLDAIAGFEGRNLLLNTNQQFDWNVSNFNESHSKSNSINFYQNYKELRGETVTFSFEVKTENLVYGSTNPWLGVEKRIDFSDGTYMFIYMGDKTISEGTTDGWVKYTKTVTIYDKEIVGYAGTIVLMRDATGIVSIRNIKLEKGTRATSWTPAPEDIEAEITAKEVIHRIYRKKVFKELPLRFPDYETIIAQESVSYIYPQSFTIDWNNREIFILYSPKTGEGSTKRWIVVFDLDDNSYKGCFHAGDSGGEGIVVKTEGENRYLYVKSQGTSLGKYLINTLPPNLTSISPAQEFNLGLYFNFSYRNGRWIVEQSGASLGNFERRTLFMICDENFNKIGNLTVDPNIGGFFDSLYSDYIPKRQGIALNDDFLVQVSGGYYGQDTPVTPFNYQGIKLIGMDGELIDEGMINPSEMVNKLIQNKFPADRIEYEGVHVNSNGDIYSLVVYNGNTADEITKSKGLIIFEECSRESSAIDFSDVKITYSKINKTDIETGVFPRASDGNMYDPITGEKLDTLDKILDFMINAEVKEFSFYSSAVTVKDINNLNIPIGYLVIIKNANNGMFKVEYFGVNNKKFDIYGDSGSRVQREVFNAGYDPVTVPLNTGVSPQFANSDLIAKKTGEGVVVLRGTLNVPTTKPYVLATLPEGYRPPFNLAVPIALSASTSGGYGVIYLKTTGEIELVYTSKEVTYCSLNGISYFL